MAPVTRIFPELLIFSEWIADAFGEYFTAFSEGYGDFTTPDVENVTGNSPRSFETFARDFAQAFGGADYVH